MQRASLYWVVGLVGGLLLSTMMFRINISPSVPIGLYRLATVPADVRPGMLVLFPAPSIIHPWWSRWLPLLKPVAAVAGETVCNIEDMLWIHDTAYGHIFHEAHGKPLPHIEGCMMVPEGAVFVASQVPKSLDSRYYGPIAVSALAAQAFPVLTWR